MPETGKENLGGKNKRAVKNEAQKAVEIARKVFKKGKEILEKQS